MAIRLLFIYLISCLFIYFFIIHLYLRCMFWTKFIYKNMFWGTVERATWWVSPGLLRNSSDIRKIVLELLWLVPGGVSLWDRQ